MPISIRPLQAEELSTADHIFRLAFGTFIGLPQPTDFYGDADYITSRWRANPSGVFAAEVEGQLVGSIIVVRWGSVGFLGPLSVHPESDGQHLIKECLIEAAIAQFDQWKLTHTGLFTFPNSPEHHRLYQQFGFYPRFLTFVMGKTVGDYPWTRLAPRFSHLEAEEQARALQQCRDLTHALYPGLDVSTEIQAVNALHLGDTVLLRDNGDRGSIVGFAVCHCGAQTEAGRDVCYVKFAAIRPSSSAEEWFGDLLNLCECFAAGERLGRLVVGVNTCHADAYQRLVERGYWTEIIGLAMHRPNQPGYHRPKAYILSDWR